MESQGQRPNKKIYALALMAILLGILATGVIFLAAFGPRPSTTFVQVLQVVLMLGAFADPIPLIIKPYAPNLLAIALFCAQIVLVLRRIVLCAQHGELVVPVTLAGGWRVLLIIALISWILGSAVFLGSIVLHALSATGGTQAVTRFFASLLFIPAANFLGVTFFVVELLSVSREGWRLRKGTIGSPGSTVAQAEGPGWKKSFSRPTAATVLTIALALLIVPPLWSVFPTGMVHQRLCKERSGERLFDTANAKGYVLIGEGASDSGFHLHHAVEDVTSGRVEFVEVIKDSRNYHQRNSLISLLGTSDPPGEVLRVSLGAAGSADCVRQLSPMYGAKFQLKASQCVRFTPIAGPTSRYWVEAIDDEQATWYTPHIRAYGVRVVDSERDAILGEHMRFARTGLLAFFLTPESERYCPRSYGFRPTQIHRKALIGH